MFGGRSPVSADATLRNRFEFHLPRGFVGCPAYLQGVAAVFPEFEVRIARNLMSLASSQSTINGQSVEVKYVHTEHFPSFT